MKEKKNSYLEAIMAAFIMFFVAAMAIDGFDLPMDAIKYPIFIFCIVAAAGIFVIVQTIKASKGADYKPVQPFENRKNFLVICGLIIGYIIVMYLLGYIISSIIFAILTAWYFKYEHMLAFSIGVAIASLGIYYCFVKLLYIFLPTGLLLNKLF